MKRPSGAASSLVAAILATMVVAGCGGDSAGDAPDVNPTNPTAGNGNPGGATPPAGAAVTAALFQPAQGVFPFPNDLYFSGTTDGTINIQPANALIPNQASLNALDGWSTTAPIRVRFGGALNPASFSAANIRVYEVTTSNTTKAVAGFTRPLTYGTDFSAGVATDTGIGPTILEIRPLVPLTPSSGTTAPSVGYLVLLLNGITMASGAPATADRDYAAIKTALGNPPLSPASQAGCATLPNATMQGACGFTLSDLLVATNPALGPLAVTPSQVLLSFHFSTQATQDTLRILAAQIMGGTPGAIAVDPQVNAPLNLALNNNQLPSYANLRIGTVTVPYYSFIPTPQAPGGISTDTRALSTPWAAAVTVGGETNLTRFNPVPTPRAQGGKAIPLVLSVPNGTHPSGSGTKPQAGWPVVIFEHGITRNRTDSFALAGAFTAAGWVVAAVDQPLHGITDTTQVPLYQASNEQTFNLDLVVNATGAAGPDGVIDPTGTHMINLSCPLCSRDNNRQAIVNLLALTRALPTLDLDANPATVDIDGARIMYVGQSLGSIAGITYGAVLPDSGNLVRRMVFSVPGGGLAELLRDSPSFGPRINAGLQAQGLLPGTTLYNQFMRDVQTVIDAGDPLNYIGSLVAPAPVSGVRPPSRAIYLQQVVGGGGTTPSLPDQVIPNSATQRLITAANAAIAAANASTTPPSPALAPLARAVLGTPVVGSGYTNFILGDHGSLLSPTSSLQATAEMQTEAVTFVAAPQPTIAVTVTYAAAVQP